MIVPERTMQTGKVCPAFEVDDDLAGRLLKHKWCLDGCGYLQTWIRVKDKGRCIKLHQAVFLFRHGRRPKPGLQIDHINRDKLDNRSCNLREVTLQENLANGGGGQRLEANKHLPKYVVYCPKKCKSKPYMAKPYRNGKNKTIGYFATPEEARAAVDLFLAEA